MTLTNLLNLLTKIQELGGIALPVIMAVFKALGTKITTDAGTVLTEAEVVAILERALSPWQRIADRADAELAKTP